LALAGPEQFRFASEFCTETQQYFQAAGSRA